MLRLCAVVSLTLTTACGAKVVFEEDGSGGSGTGSSTTTMTGSAKSTGTAASCAELEQAFHDAVADAASCSPAESSPQCTTIIDDTCGCSRIALNTKLTALVHEAENAYDQWVENGCGPIPCTQCIPVDVGYCQPTADGQSWACSASPPF